ncbi:MAG: sigma factor SigF [Synechococcus sp. WH 8007]|nr:sigma factor SigF [Synechococcus sp. WH 8007]
MISPFFACADAGSPAQMRRRHQERKHQMLTFWRDGLERQLAAINAALSTLERQMQDSAES